MLTVGFTGTRRGMTDAQEEVVRRILIERKPTLARHGDCIGADATFHRICIELGIQVILHPCTLRDQRAFCEGANNVLPEKPPLDRNHDIVNASDFMIATPAEYQDVLRSGTWATIRYARSKKRLYIIRPDRLLTA